MLKNLSLKYWTNLLGCFLFFVGFYIPIYAQETKKTSFKRKSKIFAVFNAKENRACLKLSLIDQDVFSAFDKNIIHSVPNKWGKNGWTLFYIAHLREDLFADALSTAYQEVSKK